MKELAYILAPRGKESPKLSKCPGAYTPSGYEIDVAMWLSPEGAEAFLVSIGTEYRQYFEVREVILEILIDTPNKLPC